MTICNRLGASRTGSKALIFALLLTSFTGCEFLHRNTIGLFSSSPPVAEAGESSFSSNQMQESPEATETTRVDIEELEQQKPGGNSQIEIVWEIPKEPVDGFLIHYGFEKGHLEKIVRLQSSEIEKYEDPRYGFVYRHKLTDVPPNQTVFVAMATFQGDVTSDLSEVFEVTPAKQ
jgi:hypothetical protein